MLREPEIVDGWLNVPLTRPQSQFLASEAELTLFCAGVGSGKTKAGAMWSVRECREAPGIGFVGANTYQQLTRVTLKALLAELEAYSMPYVFSRQPPASWGKSPFPDHKNILSICVDGHLRQVICSQLGSFNFHRGIEIRWFWIDETRDTKRAALDVLLGRKRGGPREAKRPGAVTTTPDGFGWLYDAFVSTGKQAFPNRKVIYANSRSNPWLPPDYIDGLLAKYSKRLADQEIGGKFVSLASGQAYAEFSRAEHVSDAYKYDPKADLIHTFDFNVNPLCSAVIQVDPRGCVWIIDEIHIEGSARTRDATSEFLDRYRKHEGLVKVYGDRSGRSEHTASDTTDFDVIEGEYYPVFRDRLSMRPNYSNPPVADSITDVNCLLKPSKGPIRLKVRPECEYTMRDFEQVVFRPGTREVDKKTDESLTHHSDAVRYFVSNEFPARSRKVSGFTPKGH